MYTFYYNYQTKESCWTTPPGFNPNIGHLTRDEIQVGYICCYLLTEFVFRTVIYEDQKVDKGLVVRTEFARSVREDRGLNIFQYENQTLLISSLLNATINMY